MKTSLQQSYRFDRDSCRQSNSKPAKLFRQILVIGITFLISVSNLVHAQYDCNCKAGDVNSVSALLSIDENGTPMTSNSCEAGETQKAYVTFIFSTTAAQRPGAYAEVNYQLNDGTVETISQCFPVVFSGKAIKLSLEIPDYVCGDKVVVSSALFGWGNGSKQSHADQFCGQNIETCEQLAPKCYSIKTPMVVDAPLIADFTSNKTCAGIAGSNTETVSLTGRATGGGTSYTYSWDLDGDGIPDAQGEELSVSNLAIGSRSVRLTVTDNLQQTDQLNRTVEVNTCAMPVRYSYIRVTPGEKSGANLEWETTEEVNSAYFEIERSLDASKYEVIGRISEPYVTKGVQKKYRFADPVSTLASCYYRIKQVDLDGSANYSANYRVDFVHRELSVTPIPATDAIFVDLGECPRSSYRVEILDITGKVIKQFQLSPAESRSRQSMNIAGVAPGIYFVKASSDSGSYLRKMMVR